MSRFNLDFLLPLGYEGQRRLSRWLLPLRTVTRKFSEYNLKETLMEFVSPQQALGQDLKGSQAEI